MKVTLAEINAVLDAHPGLSFFEARGVIKGRKLHAMLADPDSVTTVLHELITHVFPDPAGTTKP